MNDKPSEQDEIVVRYDSAAAVLRDLVVTKDLVVGENFKEKNLKMDDFGMEIQYLVQNFELNTILKSEYDFGNCLVVVLYDSVNRSVVQNRTTVVQRDNKTVTKIVF